MAVLEAPLAYLRIAAFLTIVVFMTSLAALCRPHWLNADVVRRLAHADRIHRGAWVAVSATGHARMVWGMKGFGWSAGQPLMRFKIALLVVTAGAHAAGVTTHRARHGHGLNLNISGSTFPHSSLPEAVDTGEH